MHTNCANPPWHILYRGPLSSCNYSCDYCPFAKTKNTRAELADDAEKLSQFVAWVGQQKNQTIGILFTPWGEALIRGHYQEAFAKLSQMSHIHKVSAQTNLSCTFDWLEACDLSKVALWTTYHPMEIKRSAFAERSHVLQQIGVRHSVGVVGLKEHFGEIQKLREELSPDIYLWINAYKRIPDYYTQEECDWLQSIDPLFSLNVHRHQSKNKDCQAGLSSFTVDGLGDARRCHFIPTPIGNIYEPDFSSKLQKRACPNATCGCHIGYIHLNHLKQYPIYQDGLLERIPASKIWEK